MNEVVYEKIKYIYPVASAVKARKDNDFLILTNDKSEYLFLNAVALEVYNMCDGKTSVEMIIDRIYESYDVDQEELKDDISKLLRDLQWKHLIKCKRYIKSV